VDRPDTRPLPTHRPIQHRKTRTRIHASSEIRTHDPSVRAVHDYTRLRLHYHRVRLHSNLKTDLFRRITLHLL